MTKNCDVFVMDAFGPHRKHASTYTVSKHVQYLQWITFDQRNKNIEKFFEDPKNLYLQLLGDQYLQN